MAALRQEHRYGLSCAQTHKGWTNQSLYHVKLTDTALRTLEGYQRVKVSLSQRPTICFKGNQGYLKIPAPTPEYPDGFRVFSFYLSNESKDKPQSSFVCVQQYVSGEGKDLLEGRGSIQDKITVCATDDSYQTTRERMSQVEKDTWSRSAIEIKPAPGKFVKVQRKQPLVPGSESFNKLSPNYKRNLAPSPAAQRPLLERVIHLLALKPYRKPELLRSLEREGVSPKEKADLSAVLEEVCTLNPKDHSYSLKEELYRQVQKNWPGYTEEERQLIHRLLIRKLPPLHIGQLRSPQSNHSSFRAPGDSPSQLSPVKTVKRPLNPAFLNCKTPKKQRVDQSQDTTTPPRNTENSHIRVEFTSMPLYSPHKHEGSTTVSASPQTERTAPASPSPRAALTHSPCSPPEFTNNQHKKKHKKHKGKERPRLKPDWIESSPHQKTQENSKEGEQESTQDCRLTEELPDYLIKYKPVTSIEQRQQYQEEFSAEYSEYRALHDHIRTVTDMFMQLASEINSLSPGTREYKLMEDRILQKYKRYKKRFPGYRDEKRRCQYLHHKLSHIKGLITDYDRAHSLT
ncbi:RNA polymerase II elongation factor ELL isoform X1 [Boleophthalmus pectinirostris]|uniref:RNA polymerase II elongation factor ELL isoform X1 n=1 Tax=Boleophthalmus pectinirostris TaxID=150288 RepID=UPI00242FE2D2|nr:RNA polymerase II elongation factor ELL isoform X1 [Boleophthalmus pectinirostris]